MLVWPDTATAKRTFYVEEGVPPSVAGSNSRLRHLPVDYLRYSRYPASLGCPTIIEPIEIPLPVRLCLLYHLDLLLFFHHRRCRYRRSCYCYRCSRSMGAPAGANVRVVFYFASLAFLLEMLLRLRSTNPCPNLGPLQLICDS